MENIIFSPWGILIMLFLGINVFFAAIYVACGITQEFAARKNLTRFFKIEGFVLLILIIITILIGGYLYFIIERLI